jgi:hypothetical protein
MKIELPEIRPAERTPLLEALLESIRQWADRVTELDLARQEVRDANAQWTGPKPRPKINPRTLNTPGPTQDGTGTVRRRGPPTRPRNAPRPMHHTVPLHATDLPAGATFRCCETYVVQELQLDSVNTKYLRARSDLPGGNSVPAPAGVLPVAGGHFGANLIAYVLDP